MSDVQKGEQGNEVAKPAPPAPYYDTAPAVPVPLDAMPSYPETEADTVIPPPKHRDSPTHRTPRRLKIALGVALAIPAAGIAYVLSGGLSEDAPKEPAEAEQPQVTEEPTAPTVASTQATSPEIGTSLTPILMISEDPKTLVEQEYSQNLNCAINAGGTTQGEISQTQTTCLENILGDLSRGGDLYASLSSIIIQVNQAQLENPDYKHPVEVTFLDSSMDANILTVLYTETDESGSFTSIADFERTSPLAAGIAPHSGVDLLWVMRESFPAPNPDAFTLADAYAAA